jgi:3-isopropylmalate/(R)-2-methylmalate dehydratase small subunit
LVLRGHDIDTDRIIPARFLKSVTFDGLEAHVFEDDRLAATAAATQHPFDRPGSRKASVLLVNANFGCGSSREHAPQALYRRGIRAIAGESFADIFFSNALALGLPCLTASASDIGRVMSLVEREPTTTITVSVAAGGLQAGDINILLALPETARHALVTGQWDATGLLLASYEDVETTAARLPYVRGF